MDVTKAICDKCDGFGIISRYINPDDGIHIACLSTEICDKCNGKGYTEHGEHSCDLNAEC